MAENKLKMALVLSEEILSGIETESFKLAGLVNGYVGIRELLRFLN